jgi:hypothetical protein
MESENLKQSCDLALEIDDLINKGVKLTKEEWEARTKFFRELKEATITIEAIKTVEINVDNLLSKKAKKIHDNKLESTVQEHSKIKLFDKFILNINYPKILKWNYYMNFQNDRFKFKMINLLLKLELFLRISEHKRLSLVRFLSFELNFKNPEEFVVKLRKTVSIFNKLVDLNVIVNGTLLKFSYINTIPNHMKSSRCLLVCYADTNMQLESSTKTLNQLLGSNVFAEEGEIINIDDVTEITLNKRIKNKFITTIK